MYMYIKHNNNNICVEVLHLYLKFGYLTRAAFENFTEYARISFYLYHSLNVKQE